MNLNCDIVMDCVSIYKDGLASEGTKRAVETHLKECSDCKSFYRQYDSIKDHCSSKQSASLDGKADKFAALSSVLNARRRMFKACFAIFAAITVASVIFGIIVGKRSKR